jgi:hypothetical protein
LVDIARGFVDPRVALLPAVITMQSLKNLRRRFVAGVSSTEEWTALNGVAQRAIIMEI